MQQRVFDIAALAANLNGNTGDEVLLVRRRHRWHNWHAWMIHEIWVLPTRVDVGELANTGNHTWAIIGTMRDADMWGQAYTSLWVDPNAAPGATPGTVPGAPSALSGLLQHELVRTQATVGVSTRHFWTSFPRLVAADQIQIHWGTTANVVVDCQVLVRYEDVSLPSWWAWEEAVKNSFSRRPTAWVSP